jgi:cell division protein FtsW (lipid II flippase)
LAIATNWPVLLAVFALAAVGIFSIASYEPGAAGRQVAYLVVATVLLAAFQAVNYMRVGRFAWALYGLSFLPLGYTGLASEAGGLPGVTQINGAYNWIRIAGLSVQPAEIMKVAFILALARYLRYRKNYRTLAGLVLPFALCLAPVLLILKQPDLGTAIVFGPTLLAMLFVAGARLKHLLAVILLGILTVPLVWLCGAPHVPVFGELPSFLKPYHRERVMAMFRDDEETLRGYGFQQHNALIAFGSGGVAGKGFGQIPVGRDVPEAHNDMIFALIGEQFGFVGSALVIIAYVVLFAAGLEIASNTREPFGRLVAVGVVAILASQTFLNIAVAIKLFPVTGVTLPFVSAGGSSLVASFIAAGILLNIGQHRPVVMAEDSFEFDD